MRKVELGRLLAVSFSLGICLSAGQIAANGANIDETLKVPDTSLTQSEVQDTGGETDAGITDSTGSNNEASDKTEGTGLQGAGVEEDSGEKPPEAEDKKGVDGEALTDGETESPEVSPEEEAEPPGQAEDGGTLADGTGTSEGDNTEPEGEPDPENGEQGSGIPKLITDVHKVYVSGSGNGMFNPEGTLSRAQAASIIYGLLEETSGGDAGNEFTDIPEDKWYAAAVNVCASYGIISGSGGEFRPDDPITRAEFVTILSKFSEMSESSQAFTDVDPSSWYAPYVANANAHGWISGYADGSFHPSKPVERGEAVAIVNRILGRSCDAEKLKAHLGGKRYYGDVPVDKWYFADIMEASVSHDAAQEGAGACALDAAPLTNGLSDGMHEINGWHYKIENGLFCTYPVGFNTIDGIYCHVFDGCAINTYAPGFHIINGKCYHVTTKGPAIDHYNPGFMTIENKLCYIAGDGYSLNTYPPGFNIINNTLYHVSADGYYMDKYTPGLVEIDSDLYYVAADGYAFHTNTTYHYLGFGADGKYSSGSAEVDAYVKAALAACTNPSMTQEEKRRAVYLYIRDNGAYRAYSHSLYGCNARGTTGWSLNAAKKFFDNKLRGNCYMFAGAYLYCVKQLGYDLAYPVSGGVGSNNADHAWVMMDNLIYDVELEYGYRTGKYGTVRYIDLYGTHSGDVFSYHF